ncbi:hybrid sensor histidine kinase/response regulator [Citreimonas sp.]|uniref:hybrid sensor histidine kinase/response regulator n=1 Tax=Citreimonas sp. TaxID=3036715 RepID=UPI00405A2FCE
MPSLNAADMLDRDQLLTLMQSSSAGLFHWVAETGALTWSDEVLQMLGHTAEPDAHALVHPADRNAFIDALEAGASSDQVMTATLRLRNADEAYLSFNATGLRTSGADGVSGVAGFLQSIAGEVDLREALDRSERLFNEFFENCPASAYIKTLDGRNVYGNRLAAEWWGLSREDLARSNARDFFDPDAYERVQAHDAEVVRSGNPITWTGRIKARTGEYRIIRASKFPVQEPSTGETMVGGFSIDMTREKEAEEALFHSRKLDSLGQLVGGVAHDFNNSLAVMLGNLELAETEVDPDLRAEMFRDIHEAIERSRNLTRTLLVYGRRAILEPSALDMVALLKGVVGMMRRTFPETVTIDLRLDGAPGPVWADKSQVEDMILNLALNARDAMPEGGALTISAKIVQLPGSPTEVPGLPKGGRFVVVEVADTGEGIAPDFFEKIFEPYFTTKPVDKGAGLGLSLVQSYMHQLGGCIDLSSTQGLGSVFRLYFPVSDGQALPIETPAAASLDRSYHVLLVEDDPAVLRAARGQLEKIGCTVTPALSGAEALRLFQADATIDVVITDLVMPGAIRGRDLARRVVALRPGTPVIFVSGYPMNEPGEDAENAVTEGVTMMKPVSKEQFAAALAALDIG